MDRQELKELIRGTVKEVIDEENPIYKDLPIKRGKEKKKKKGKPRAARTCTGKSIEELVMRRLAKTTCS